MLIEYRRDGRIFINGRMVARTRNPEGLLQRLLSNLAPPEGASPLSS